MKGIATSEIGKQAKDLRLEPAEMSKQTKGLRLERVKMTVQQVNGVSSTVFDTWLEASLPGTDTSFICKNEQISFHA